MKKIHVAIVLGIVNTIISASLALGFKSTPSESLLIGFGVFIILSFIESIPIIIRALETREKQQYLQLESNEIDNMLGTIQNGLARIKSNKGDFSPYMSVFIRELQQVSTAIQTLSTTGRLPVNERYLFLLEEVLENMEGRDSDEIRLVHLFQYNDHATSVHEKQWIRNVHTKVLEKKVSKVKRLFVYKNQEEIEGEISQLLMSIHFNQKKYDARVISAKAFDTLRTDLDIIHHFADFGIYGNAFIFVGEHYLDGELRGWYQSNENDVKVFSNFYETCWNNATPVSEHLTNLDKSKKISDLLE